MTHNAKIALNPLPWVLTERGFELSVPVLRQAFSEIASPPFRAIHAHPPEGLTPTQYRSLLAEYGLVPAPARRTSEPSEKNCLGQNFEPVGIAVVGWGNISDQYPKNLVRFSIRKAQGPDNETSWFRSARSGCEKQISKTQIAK